MNENYKREVAIDEILDFAKTHVGFAGLDLNRISKLFLFQIFIAHEYRQYNIFSVLEEVKCLEKISNRTMTKESTEFKNLPLKGLWHKHFFDASFMSKNIGNHWGSKHGGNKKLLKMIDNVLKSGKSGIGTDTIVNQIAHKCTTEAFQDRVKNKQITGEWIIYAIKDSKNYYLTIASHTESDAEMYKRIQTICAKEFPDVLPVNT